jgi:hypothetical protein
MVNLWQCSPGAFDSITVPDIVSFEATQAVPTIMASLDQQCRQPLSHFTPNPATTFL